MGPAPKQIPRSENKAIQLPIFSRWEAPVGTGFLFFFYLFFFVSISTFYHLIIISQKIELSSSLRTPPTPSELLYQHTKNLIVQILRTLPPQPTKSLSLKVVIDTAMATKNDTVIMRKGLQAADGLRKLEADGRVSSSNNYAELTAEVGQVIFDLFFFVFSFFSHFLYFFFKNKIFSLGINGFGKIKRKSF